MVVNESKAAFSRRYITLMGIHMRIRPLFLVGALATALFILLSSAEVRSETVDVKYRGPVDLKTFECGEINRSSAFATTKRKAT